MHQPGVLGHAEDSQRFFLCDGPVYGAFVESIPDRREDETRLKRVTAVFAKKMLLFATDAITDSP
jgi:hypothetical protein